MTERLERALRYCIERYDATFSPWWLHRMKSIQREWLKLERNA